jgi:hypothetical protein
MCLMRTVAIPEYRSTPGNEGAYALRTDGRHRTFLMVTFSEFGQQTVPSPGTTSALRNTTTSIRIFLLTWNRYSTHYEMCDR